jgi:hypothetical protein
MVCSYLDQLNSRSRLMDAAINRGGRDAGFAVIRNYAPARIERELLAQIFDIVQYGDPLRVASLNRSDSAPDSTLTASIGDDSAANAQGHGRDDQRVTREATA